MRATLTTSYRAMVANLTRQNTKLEGLRNQAATGKKMVKPSDDPAGIRPVLNARTLIRNSERFLLTMGKAGDRLDNLDTQMERLSDLMARFQESVVAAGNGAASTQDLAIYGGQIKLLKEELLAIANVKVDGKYIFSGFAEDVKPYDGNPGSYFGDNGTIEFEVAPGEKVKTNLTGPQIFGDPGSGKDMWQLLDDVAAALMGGNASAALSELGNVELAAEKVRASRSEMGNIAARVEQAMISMEDTRIDMKAILSRYEDADLIDTITNLTLQETGFKGALEVTTRISQLTILNYLK